jgi:hypothetical protein
MVMVSPDSLIVDDLMLMIHIEYISGETIGGFILVSNTS